MASFNKAAKVQPYFYLIMLSTGRINTLMQLALMIGLVGVAFVLISVLTMGLASAADIPLMSLQDYLLEPENVTYFRAYQVINAFIIWGLPAIGVAALSGPRPIEQLGFREHLHLKLILLALAITFISIFLGGALAEVNEKIPLTAKMKETFDAMEKMYSQQVMALGKMNSFADYFFSIIILALVPAIFEELFFRGCMQQIFVALTKNAFAGILITSIIFSALHGSFYGFIPRVCLGLILGYMFQISGNIWYAVLAHFFNNAWSVTTMYVLNLRGKLTEDALDESFPIYYGAIALIIVIFLFRIFKKESEKFNRNLIHTDETAVD